MVPPTLVTVREPAPASVTVRVTVEPARTAAVTAHPAASSAACPAAALIQAASEAASAASAPLWSNTRFGKSGAAAAVNTTPLIVMVSPTSTVVRTAVATLAFVLAVIVQVAVAIAAKNYGEYVFMHFPVLSVVESLFISLLCGSLISVVAAIAPAYMAAKKQPVEALRVEE